MSNNKKSQISHPYAVWVLLTIAAFIAAIVIPVKIGDWRRLLWVTIYTAGGVLCVYVALIVVSIVIALFCNFVIASCARRRYKNADGQYVTETRAQASSRLSDDHEWFHKLSLPDHKHD